MTDTIETSESKRDNLRVLGRTIGTYSGWDGDDSTGFVFYAFKPIDVLATELPEGDLNMNWDTGEFTYWLGDGEEFAPYKVLDMLTILNMVQRDPDPMTVEAPRGTAD